MIFLCLDSTNHNISATTIHDISASFDTILRVIISASFDTTTRNISAFFDTPIHYVSASFFDSTTHHISASFPLGSVWGPHPLYFIPKFTLLCYI